MKGKRGKRSRREPVFLIPGLPNDIALTIFARLPPVVRARLQVVCRSWKHSMEPAAMSSIRKTLHIHDAWLIVTNSGSLERYVFAMVDPFSGCTRKIAPPPQFCTHSSFLEFHVCGHEVLISVKARPGASPKGRERQGLYSFDGVCMKWNDAKYSSLPSGRVRAIYMCAGTDMEGGYLYIVEEYSAVQRLDLKTKLWEVLPDPHVKRASFSAVMLQNRLCIVGGRDDWRACESGEIWDPIDHTWTLVPELWPCYSCFPSGRVVVVMDQLYALRMRCRSVELMYYATSSKVWISLGDVPVFDDCRLYFNRLALAAMDQELWVIAFNCSTVWTTKPSLSNPLTWRILSNKADESTFVGAMLV